MCGVELTSDNKSREHILLNAIGGKLRSDKLVCKNCNSIFGDEFDALLAKQLQVFSVLLDVSRDDGETPPIVATRSSNGEKIMVMPGGKPGLYKPEVTFQEENGKKVFHVVARSPKELNRIYKGIKAKHPSAHTTDSGNKTENINELINIEFDLGGQSFLSVCKTAICYFLHVGGNQCWIQNIIDRFKANDVLHFCNFCYLEKQLIQKEDDSICHTIVLVGDSKSELLYSYIELFNFYHIIVLLNDRYDGEDISHSYCYDLIKRKEINVDICSLFSRVEIEEALSHDIGIYAPKLVKELNATKMYIENKNTVEKVFNMIFEKYKDQYPDGIPTDLFAKEFSESIVTEMMPYILKNIENDEN